MVRNLQRQQRRRTEAVQTEPATLHDAGHLQRPIPDHTAAEERCRLDVAERFGDREHEVGTCSHRLGESTVAIPSGEHRIGAEILGAAATSSALTTRAREPGHTDSIADLPTIDTIADGSHPADDLMARHERQVSGGQITLRQLQVRSAHSACRDLDDDLTGLRARVVVVDGHERMRLDRSRLSKLLCPAHGTPISSQGQDVGERRLDGITEVARCLDGCRVDEEPDVEAVLVRQRRGIAGSPRNRTHRDDPEHPRP